MNKNDIKMRVDFLMQGEEAGKEDLHFLEVWELDVLGSDGLVIGNYEVLLSHDDFTGIYYVLINREKTLDRPTGMVYKGYDFKEACTTYRTLVSESKNPKYYGKYEGSEYDINEEEKKDD